MSEIVANRYRAELHLHSCWSLLDGASSSEELIFRARELGYETIALTDHDGLYGSMEFAQAAKAFGIRAITGAEVTLEDGHHLTLLAATTEGYNNLCRLLSTAHLSGERKQPRLPYEALAQHTSGLIALSGCKRGEVPAACRCRRYRGGRSGNRALRRLVRARELLHRTAAQSGLRRYGPLPPTRRTGARARPPLRRHERRALSRSRPPSPAGRDGGDPQSQHA